MRKYIIERDMPGVGSLSPDDLTQAARKSNAALEQLGTGVQWLQSYVTGDKIFCVYVANDEALIREHARLSGFPATRIAGVTAIIDPATAD